MKKLSNILLVILWGLCLFAFFKAFDIDYLSYIIGAVLLGLLTLIIASWEQ